MRPACSARRALKNTSTRMVTGTSTVSINPTVAASLARKIAVLGTGARSRARTASPSRSRSKARPRPTTPEIRMATHRMPATTVGGGGVPPTTNAKLNTSTTTTARKPLVKRISRLLHSIERSLAAIRAVWVKKPGATAAGVGISSCASCEGLPARAPSATAALVVGGAERGGAPGRSASLVAHDTPAAQDQDVLRQGG